MRYLENFKEETKFKKVISVIGLVYAVVLTIVLILYLFIQVEWVDKFLPLLVAPIFIIDAILEWKKNEKSALLFIGVAILAIVSFIIKWMRFH
jgi:hypothetical protein